MNSSLWQRAVCSMLLSADLCTQPLPKRPTVFMQARLATSRVQSRLLQTQRSATRLHSHQIPQKNRSPATVRHSLWFSAVSTLLTVQDTATLKMHLKSFSLTMRLFRLIPKHRLLSDSVSVADFWDCSTWKSFRSDLKENISLTSSQPHRV